MTDTTPIDYARRMQHLLDATQADVVALVPGANMVYFTGLHVHLSERPTIAFITREEISFIMPRLEVSKLDRRTDLAAGVIEWRDDAGYESAFETAVDQFGLAQSVLGVDGQTMRVFEWLALQRHGADTAGALDIGQVLLQLRARKQPAEVDAMREAIRISEAALRDTIDAVRVGMSEREIARLLETEMQARGAERKSFETLVLIGENSALPHGTTGDRQLRDDDFLLIDFGAVVGGYPADITRTFCIGDASGQMREIYDAVQQANAAARDVAAPGVTCGAVDAAARDVIEAAGYGDYFTHRTGHGIGLEVHELPQIAAGNEMLLEPGMVFTIEPGIYLPQVGGVRIEDNMLVTEDGVESLTTFPRDL